MAFRSKHISERPQSSIVQEQEKALDEPTPSSASARRPGVGYMRDEDHGVKDVRAAHGGDLMSAEPHEVKQEKPLLDQSSEHLSEALLSYRDEMVIRSVGKHKQWSGAQIEKAIRFVREDREKYFPRIELVYEQEVKPQRQRAPSIQDWISAHPHEIAFQFENDLGEIQSKVLSRQHPQASHYELYHGVLMRRVPASATMFPPPDQLFVKSEDLGAETTEAAFGEEAPNPTKANSSSDSDGVGHIGFVSRHRP